MILHKSQPFMFEFSSLYKNQFWCVGHQLCMGLGHLRLALGLSEMKPLLVTDGGKDQGAVGSTCAATATPQLSPTNHCLPVLLFQKFCSWHGYWKLTKAFLCQEHHLQLFDSTASCVMFTGEPTWTSRCLQAPGSYFSSHSGTPVSARRVVKPQWSNGCWLGSRASVQTCFALTLRDLHPLLVFLSHTLAGPLPHAFLCQQLTYFTTS